MITTNLTGNLGNHMWQYAVCRTVAEKLGYEWGIDPQTTNDYHQGNSQMTFMDVDFGKPVSGILNNFHERWDFHEGNGEKVWFNSLDKRVYEIEDNTRLIGDNGVVGGIYQSENYIVDRRDDIKEWFKINASYKIIFDDRLNEMGISLNDNLCVINFRGGEYRNIPNIFLRKEYWRDPINHMKSINENMEFLIVTDDVPTAKNYMPFDIKAIHVDIGFDFYVVNQAKWLIISNSTFSWWAAWLNDNSNKILAPKYFISHNLSDGYWSQREIYTSNFEYMDREGVLYDYDTCKKEALEYNKKINK